jgi:hypothetical protein
MKRGQAKSFKYTKFDKNKNARGAWSTNEAKAAQVHDDGNADAGLALESANRAST